MPEFKDLPEDVRRRLEESGIDIEASYRAFQAEIRISPPPLLLQHLGMTPIVREEEIGTQHHPSLGFKKYKGRTWSQNRPRAA